jgi:hypothetical protein
MRINGYLINAAFFGRSYKPLARTTSLRSHPQLRGLYRTLKALGAGGTGRNHHSAATDVIIE